MSESGALQPAANGILLDIVLDDAVEVLNLFPRLVLEVASRIALVVCGGEQDAFLDNFWHISDKRLRSDAIVISVFLSIRILG